MRNMILKTIIASILGSLLITPVAHADRQGGGTMKVSLDRLPLTAPAGWVRFAGIQDTRVLFEFESGRGYSVSIENVSLEKSELANEGSELIRALRKSKEAADWAAIEL